MHRLALTFASVLEVVSLLAWYVCSVVLLLVVVSVLECCFDFEAEAKWIGATVALLLLQAPHSMFGFQASS